MFTRMSELLNYSPVFRTTFLTLTKIQSQYYCYSFLKSPGQLNYKLKKKKQNENKNIKKPPCIYVE